LALLARPHQPRQPRSLTPTATRRSAVSTRNRTEPRATLVKAGFVIGGQGGEGVLFVRGRPPAYYKIRAVSYGLQAGGQSFSYALFLMNDKALRYLDESNGWAIGAGPSVVVVDQGKALSTTSTTVAKDVYAFPFGQKGLMAGMGLEGSKISRIQK
jgi:lipid-binding SYLF domain-containing protein